MPQIWAGMDIGKEHHHCVVIDSDGKKLLSRRVLNDEPVLLELISDVLAISEDALWAVDINYGGAALASLRSCRSSRTYYDRKPAEGKTHSQALLALSRRRVNVLWAMLRDGECYYDSPPVTMAA